FEMDNGGKGIVPGWPIAEQDVTISMRRAGSTMSVYYRLDDDDGWTLLGTATMGTGPSTTQRVYLAGGSGEDRWPGRLHYARLWVGGDAESGTPRFDFDPTRDAEASDASVTSST